MNRQILNSCELEPLHLSGAILGHGTLLVIDRDGIVSHVGANIAEWLGAPPEAWLGKPPPIEWADTLADLGNNAGSRLAVKDFMKAPAGTHKQQLDLVASRNEQAAVVFELFTASDEVSTFHSLYPTSLPSLESWVSDAAAIQSTQNELVQRIMEITGFQRVMLYSFREDGDGEVIAEAREEAVYGSYLGLRFPASDIPHIARLLYLKNPWRLIPDATADLVPLLGCDDSPPDLTYSDLRSVSPVHRVYLANMGVRASLSFPIIVGGSLVALVACHHAEACHLPLATLNQARYLTHEYSMGFSAYQSRQRLLLIDGLVNRFASVRLLLQRHGDLFSAWPELGAWLISEFKADGAILCLNDEATSLGATFDAAALASFDDWFCNGQSEIICFCNSLMRQVSELPLSEVAGVLAIRIKQRDGNELRLYLTRMEYIHEVVWGGNPEKPFEIHDGLLGIAPRHSFEKWVEKRLGYSRPWDNESRLLGFKLRELLMTEVSALVNHAGKLS